MKNTCLSVARILIFLSFCLFPASMPAQTSIQPALDAEESAFVGLLNTYRAANGAGPLTVSPTLSNSSKWMSTDMASKNYFSHTDSLGRDPGTRIAAFGYPYFPWGENLAAGYSDAQSTLNQWINACDADASGTCTYAHRNNMLNGSFKAIGVGRASGGTYGTYWTTDFGGVVDQPQNSAPAITSFSAAPSVITAGQTANLIWNVSGATTITIDNGVGDVSAATSRSVSPAGTTTYLLTATNSSGSSSARVTITVTPVRIAPPVISSFYATPSTISPGQSATLLWSVSGATSISIDNGVGDVTNAAFRTVTPAVTTTYHLTAANASGSNVGTTTVTVNVPAGDTQAPTAPVITSASAKSASEADLTWTASSDNVGVAGYQIFRNGSPVTSINGTGLSWADNSVSPGTTYTYAVKAFDAAGNYSAASNVASVTTPGPTVSTGCPAPVNNAFTGCYYNNIDLTGSPVLVRTDGQINFDWSGGTPGPSVPAAFSVRWQGNFDFDQATYLFTAITSDGVRIYIDGNLALDRWWDHPPNRSIFQPALTMGTHLITVEYYERSGIPAAHLSWQSLGGSGGTAPMISSFTSSPSSITAGGSATLSWNVTGASALSIDNGIGDVTGSTYKTVSPGATTTYKITAANSSGSNVAMTSITVIVPTGDTQPPTAPVITSATAKSSMEVDLAWTASTDNVGIAGYQILRNGSAVTSVSAASLSWVDNTVSPNAAYSYVVKAFDAAANYSTGSNVAVVTTPGAVVSTGCLAPATNSFTSCYYDNISLTGNPVLVRTDSQINFDWSNGTPGPSVPAAFSARWSGNFDFNQATYTFTAITSDGVRVYIDGNLVLDKWSDHPAYRFVAQPALTMGRHLVMIEYYEQTGSPAAHLSWQQNP